MSNVLRVILALMTALMLNAGMTAPAIGQAQTGNLNGWIVDQQGSPLPGVTVTLSCDGAPEQVQVSDEQGRFRFTMSTRDCRLTAELDGFSSLDYPNVTINNGRTTTMELTMSLVE
jgi:hypothetical protein